MLLSNILHERVIKMEVRSQGKAHATEELVDLLIEAGEIPLSLRAHALETIAERERQIGTGMDFGVAIPHGSSDRVPSLVGALGISHSGVDFQSRDGGPAHIIVLLLIPRQSFQEHIQAMAATAKVMRQDEVRGAILDARTPKELMRIIEEAEISGAAG